MIFGMYLVLVVIVVGVIVMMIGFLVGKYVFKLNWILLFGVVCGGMILILGFGVVVDVFDSDDLVVGYGVMYLFVLLIKVILVIVLYKFLM